MIFVVKSVIPLICCACLLFARIWLDSWIVSFLCRSDMCDHSVGNMSCGRREFCCLRTSWPATHVWPLGGGRRKSSNVVVPVHDSSSCLSGLLLSSSCVQKSRMFLS